MKIVEKVIPPQWCALSDLKPGDLFVFVHDKNKVLHMVIDTTHSEIRSIINNLKEQCLVVSLGSLNNTGVSDKFKVWIFSNAKVIKYKLTSPLNVELDK